MTDHIYNYRDENIGFYQLNDSYTLLLQLYAASFSYALVRQNRLIAWCEDCDIKLLNDPGQNHEFLHYDFKNVVTGVQPAGFTLLPDALYDESRVNEIARFLDVRPRDKVFAQPFDDGNHIIYKVNDTISKKAEKFGLQKVVHMSKGWVTAIAGSNPQSYNLYLNIDKKQVEIAYFASGKLRFFNAFAFHNPDELVYYTGLVAKELDLAPRSTNLVLSGDINMDDNNAARLAVFFNGIEENTQKILELPAEIFPHQVLSLTALSLCVSSEVY